MTDKNINMYLHENDWHFHKSWPIFDFLGSLEKYIVELSIFVAKETVLT